MKRDPRLVRLSWDHHHGLVMARRIAHELPGADDAHVARLYADLVAFWVAGLLPHFRAENECLLARLVRHLSAEHETVRRTLDDHLALDALVVAMRDTVDLETRRAHLTAFGARLQEHIRWEEAVLFDATQAALTDGELDALGREIEERIPGVIAAPQP